VEVTLSRVINTEGAGKERTRLSKLVVVALRELVQQKEPDETTRDLVAFVSESLQQIYDTVETSVVAWEKRGYWVKADRFRLEWEWAGIQGAALKKALLADDWGSVALISAQVGQKFNKVKQPARKLSVIPWTGAWKRLKSGK
jgi:hypothetical protein